MAQQLSLKDGFVIPDATKTAGAEPLPLDLHRILTDPDLPCVRLCDSGWHSVQGLDGETFTVRPCRPAAERSKLILAGQRGLHECRSQPSSTLRLAIPVLHECHDGPPLLAS